MNRLLNEANRLSIFLRIAVTVCICVLFQQAQSGLHAQTGGITAKDPGAQEAMNTALKALGGADKIAEIKSLIIKGKGISTSNVTKGVPETDDFEIRALFPDNIISIIRYPDHRTTYTRISREKLLSLLDTTPGSAAESSKMLSDWGSIRGLSYLLVGMLMKSGPAPMTMSSRLMNRPGFDLSIDTGRTGSMINQIEFDAKTGYPSTIRYSMDAGYTGEIHFRDRFPVEGIMFPRVITSAIPAASATSERRIEEVQINPKLSMKDFEVPE